MPDTLSKLNKTDEAAAAQAVCHLCKEVGMDNDCIIERLLRLHPHFRQWIFPRGRTRFAVVAIQYAVIEKWNDTDDVDALFERLKASVSEWNGRHDHSLPLPEKLEFADAVRLYPLMIMNVPWTAASDPVERRPWEAEILRERRIARAAPASDGYGTRASNP